MENLGYYNGTVDLIENIRIPMTDRVCYFGDGVYDATYAHNHKIFDLKNHIDRFFNSAGLMRMDIGMSKEEVGALLEEMVKKVDAQTQFVYWQVTRGSEIRNHAWKDGIKGNLWIMIKPASITDLSQKIKVISQGRYPFPALQRQDFKPASLCSGCKRSRRSWLPGMHFPPR